ncbi:MAG: helix-turn-helix transcriptional regulator [Ruminococcaceae bacterium]|nr:helix-turn-helix transcriptional regulator [Oscillospiraceae bacterium]
MNQQVIGKFITLKRKEKNLTQEQLAEKIGVSNKTISKWENGKCMPDYSVIEILCKELDVTVSELLDGEENEKSIRLYDEKEIIGMIKDIQELKKSKDSNSSFFLIIMGISLLALSFCIEGSEFKDFVSGFLLGISVVEMILGIYLLVRTMNHNKVIYKLKVLVNRIIKR